MSAEDEAESTTKATVSEGEIEIRDKENQKQDLAGLNRDTQNALNKLGEIFDKDSIEERQELAGLFGELAYNQIHFMEGTDEQKAAYHALVGGIMAELTNGDFLAGASAAAVNKLVVEEINKIANGDPAMAQWLSAALGAVITGDKSGASIAASGTKNNFYHLWFKGIIQSLDTSGLEANKAYAITIGTNGKEIAKLFKGSPGLIIGCYIALNPKNNEVVVFDTTGAQMSWGIGEIETLFKNFGVTITEVDFGNQMAVDKLEGNTLNGSLDLSSVHIGGSINIESVGNFVDQFSQGSINLKELFVSTEAGISTSTKLGVAVGLSNTVKMGEASNPLTWTPFGSVKDESIKKYINDYPSDNYLIYQNNITKELSVIAKTDNGYATIVGFNENNIPQWEHTMGLPDDRFYTLLN